MKKKKVGFYGGTFDPIHFGHINLALEIASAHQLDEVLFCPAAINPHKQGVPPNIPLEHRLKITELGIDGIKHFKMTDIEVNRKGPSYTIDTLEELDSLSKNDYFLVLGDDALKGFTKWHRYRDILKLAPLLIGTRYPHLAIQSEDPILNTAIQSGMTKIPIMEISSTEIRNRLKKNLYIRHLVPDKVVDYIYQNHLYY